MASIFGHAVAIVGIHKLIPKHKLGSKALLLGVISAILPDIDVLAYKFGISSIDILGHRGFTHSIIFAIAWAAILVYLFHAKDNSKYPFLFYFICTVSHGLLDALTTGGNGIAFLWPITSMRYFAPYRFIEVSPIGVGAFFSEWGIKVLISEFKFIAIPSLVLMGIGYLMNNRKKS